MGALETEGDVIVSLPDYLLIDEKNCISEIRDMVSDNENEREHLYTIAGWNIHVIIKGTV